jgi:hypothetical protein
MNITSRRHLGGFFVAGAALALAGCAKVTSAAQTVITDAGKVEATIATDATTLINNYGIAKGLLTVAEAALSVSNPALAATVAAGVALVDGWVKAGAATVEANASQMVATTQTIYLAAAPLIQATQNDVAKSVVAAAAN